MVRNQVLVWAVLLWCDGDAIVEEETHAAPNSLDDAATAIARLRARKPVLVARGDMDAVLDGAREREG